MFAIRYRLKDVESIQPWGGAEKTLGWYGMSYGCHCIETDAGRLLEYFNSKTSRAQWCDYQVARLFEDMLTIWPHASEPVQENVVEFFKCRSPQDLDNAVEAWITQAFDATDDNDEDRLDRIDQVRSWWRQRYIQFAHLAGTPELGMWRIGDTMHLRWNGDESWLPERASLSIPFETVHAGIDDFVHGFLQEMRARVSHLAQGGSARIDCVIDVERCLAEQAEREADAIRALSTQAEIDWHALRRLLRDCA